MLSVLASAADDAGLFDVALGLMATKASTVAAAPIAKPLSPEARLKPPGFTWELDTVRFLR
jgi:hypothetical protein